MAYRDVILAEASLQSYWRGLRFDTSQFPKAIMRPPVPVRY